MSDVGTYYDNFGYLYEPLWGDNIHWGLFSDHAEALPAATALYTHWTSSLLAPRAGGVIIDAGVGPASTARHLILAHGVSVIGIDASGFQLQRATRSSGSFLSTGSLRLLRANLENGPLPIQSADGAISLATFFHLHNRSRAFFNVGAALKPGTNFVVDDLSTEAPQADIDAAFGRLGTIRLESEACYTRLIDDSPFTLEASFDITPDFALTYARLIERLDTWRQSGDSRLSTALQNTLSTSFRIIQEMAVHRRLLCTLRVLRRR